MKYLAELWERCFHLGFFLNTILRRPQEIGEMEWVRRKLSRILSQMCTNSAAAGKREHTAGVRISTAKQEFVCVEASLMLLILQWYGKSEKERRSHGKDAAVCADHYPNQMKPDASFPVQFPTCSTLCYEQYLLQRRGLVGISNRKCRNLLIMLLARGYITAT